MANHLKGEVEIVAGGEKFIFRLGVNEMIEAQDALGLADQDAQFFSILSRSKSLKHVRALLWVGLKGSKPDLTIERAGELVAEIGFAKLPGIIQEAMRWAMPEPTPPSVAAGEKKKGGRPRPSPGPQSS